MTTDDEVTRYHREKDVPLALQKKLELLRHFTEYMDDFLTEGEPPPRGGSLLSFIVPQFIARQRSEELRRIC